MNVRITEEKRLGELQQTTFKVFEGSSTAKISQQKKIINAINLIEMDVDVETREDSSTDMDMEVVSDEEILEITTRPKHDNQKDYVTTVSENKIDLLITILERAMDLDID